MPINVIDTLKPKNSGFPVAEAADISVSSTQRLPEALAAKADAADLEQVSSEVAAKADSSAVSALSSDIYTALGTKASDSETRSATANLQAQIDTLAVAAPSDAEVVQARVSADGETFSTIESRLNSDYVSVIANLKELSDKIVIESPNLYVKGYTEQELGYLATETATELTPSNNYLTIKVKIKPNTKYTVTHSRHWGGFFDILGNKVGVLGGNGADYDNYTVTSPARAAYMWVCVQSTTNMNAYMVVEGETMPSTYVKGTLTLNPVFLQSNTLSPIYNARADRKVVFDCTTKELVLPKAVIAIGNKSYVYNGATIDASSFIGSDSCVMLYDYILNTIVFQNWNTAYAYPIIGIIYGDKVWINGVNDAQIIYKYNGVIPEEPTVKNAYVCIRQTMTITYNSVTKVLSIPGGAFNIINNSGAGRASTTTLELADILVSDACLLWMKNNGTIYATSWIGDQRTDKKDSLIGYIYREIVQIFGVPDSFIKVESSSGTQIECFGDSITAGVGTTYLYHMYLSDWHKTICHNWGIGGTGYVWECKNKESVTGNGAVGLGTSVYQTGENTILDIMQTVQTISKCTIFGGTNDWYHNINISTFRTAVQNTLDYALTKTAYILVILPLIREGYKVIANGQGLKLEAYNNVIREECEARGIAYYDGFEVTLNPDNAKYKTNYIPDGLHPNANGHKMLARKIELEFMANMGI